MSDGLPEGFVERENRPIPAALVPDANVESLLCDWSRALTLCNATLIGDKYCIQVLLPMLHDCDEEWCPFLAKIEAIEILLEQVEELLLMVKSLVLSSVISQDDKFLDMAFNCSDLALESIDAVKNLLDMELYVNKKSKEVTVQTTMVPICVPTGEEEKQEAQQLVYCLYVFRDTLLGIVDVLFTFREVLMDLEKNENEFEVNAFPCHSLRLLSNAAQGIELLSVMTKDAWLKSKGSQKSQKRTKQAQSVIDVLEAVEEDAMRFYSPLKPEANDQDWLENRIGVYSEVVFKLEHLQSIGKVPNRVESQVHDLMETVQAWIAEAEIFKSELVSDN